MDEQDQDFELGDLEDDTEAEADTARFYWALKAALARTPLEPPPPSA